MSASYPPDVLLKNFVDTYLQSHATANSGAFPTTTVMAELIYYGSDSTHYTGADTVLGIAELITGQTPTDT